MPHPQKPILLTELEVEWLRHLLVRKLEQPLLDEVSRAQLDAILNKLDDGADDADIAWDAATKSSPASAG